ncbi:serine protease [Microbispora amethystogenes]|nr:serine protease [Microbispora amethystogenes]
MKRAVVIAFTFLVTATSAAAAKAGQPVAEAGRETEYVVLYKEGVNAAHARGAIQAAGGRILKENGTVGLATVSTTDPGFTSLLRGSALIEGVARNRSVGGVPENAPMSDGAVRKALRAEAFEEPGTGERGTPSAAKRRKPAPQAEPLSELQWDMKQIGATVDGSYKYGQGDPEVLVAILDTGVDGSHPDIAPNFNRELSRNFTVDIPVDADGEEVDGPCEEEPDRSCEDPADVDEDGHGTHVASALAAPINGLGIAGVAPKVSIVNLRVGSDAGYFFLQPSVDALTYAADIGVDVANMSFYTDPWLSNCTGNPSDSPEERLEQTTIRSAMQRALDYAHARGVTLITAIGNQAVDLTKDYVDSSSPNFVRVPGEKPHSRTITPDCDIMPVEGNHVIRVSATGVSERKSFGSNYGDGSTDLAAPGGDTYDTPDNTRDTTRATLAAYPKALAVARGELNPDGTPNVARVVRDCDDAVCAYYQYDQGTSMASPRAAGVAALIVSEHGHQDREHGGKTLNPDVVEAMLKTTATRKDCPTPAAYTYTRHLPNGTTVTDTHLCEGNRFRNGFYGYGIVNALRAVR